MASTFDLLVLNHLPGVGPHGVRAVRERGVAEVLARPEAYEKLLGAPAVAALVTGRARSAASDELRRAARDGVVVVGADDDGFPPLLRESYDPPAVLYVRGRWPPPPAAPPLAMVGTRRASAGGRRMARSMARDLARAGVVVISGLARGIDAEAHEGALEGGGYTLAVLGSGLARLYPPEHAGLAERIARSGALVSEFPLDQQPLAGQFPRRNRIIAGLSRAVVVVEAPIRSGAMITARLAIDGDRDVLAVPGHPSDPAFEGTNSLIRQGAALIRSVRDVAHELQLTLDAPAPAPGLLAWLERDRPRSIDDLQSRTGRPLPELLRELTELELSASVERLPGALYVRSG